MGRIIHRYLFREVTVPFLLGLSLFTFILLVARLLKLIELVVSRGVPFLYVVRLISYIMPAFLEVTVPMAMLLAILIAFGRLSADSELIALRASGVSLYQLVPPVALFVTLATAVTALLAIHARPWGNRSLQTALYELARTRASAGLKPEIFNDDFPGLVIYAERIEPGTGHLLHVLISDEREPGQRNIILAREGLMISDAETQTVTLRLLNGAIQSADTKASAAQYHTEFQSYDVNLDLRQAFAGLRERERDPKEMTMAQLRRAIRAKQAERRPYGPELAEYHRKFAIPFACVVFGLVGVPLGIQPARAVKVWGFALSLALIFVYYMLLTAGQALAEQNLAPAWLGLWLPNLAFLILGTYLFRQAVAEREILALSRLRQGLATARGFLSRRLGLEGTP